MATLYEMTQSAAQLYELLQADQIDEQTYNDTLEAMGVEEKLKAYCEIIGQLNADIEMYKTEGDRIAARKKTAQNSVDRLKQAVIDFLKQSGQEKAKAGTFSVALSASKSVNITDESKVPPRFLIEQPPKVDKWAIREALNNGETVDGAELLVKDGVRIR